MLLGPGLVALKIGLAVLKVGQKTGKLSGKQKQVMFNAGILTTRSLGLNLALR